MRCDIPSDVGNTAQGHGVRDERDSGDRSRDPDPAHVWKVFGDATSQHDPCREAEDQPGAVGA